MPIVEPEVLMDGDHTLERCFKVTEEVLQTVFNQLYAQGVMLEGMLLKPNMVLPGLTCPKQETVDEVADATVRCLLRTVPAAVPGIMFLSGGQSSELASARLNAMNVRFESKLPWALSFSFGRAIQQPALDIWQGKEMNLLAAQKALYHRAKCNQAARIGEYNVALEKDMSMDLMSSSNRTPVIAGNWKMHKSIEEAVSFVQELIPLIQMLKPRYISLSPIQRFVLLLIQLRTPLIIIGAEKYE